MILNHWYLNIQDEKKISATEYHYVLHKEICDPILGYTDLMGWSPQALGLSIMETHLSS